jgi:hypothetical protein
MTSAATWRRKDGPYALRISQEESNLTVEGESRR